MAFPASLQRHLLGWLTGDPDQAILRWIFRSVLASTVALLAIDLAQINGLITSAPVKDLQSRPELADPLGPGSMPSVVEPALPQRDKRLVLVPPPDDTLSRPMSFELASGGRLMATGTITPGTSQLFAAEIDKRGDYVKTVVLNSPGGSVADALAIGRLIRKRNFATRVEAGRYCASACPLVFAGGVERHVDRRGLIGVHQIAAVKSAPGGLGPDEMSLAQRASAQCLAYLVEMGVNPRVWVHAMETPHDRLFVFQPDELAAMNLITADAPLASPAAIQPLSRS
ncbi:hypothetical protein BSZ21_02260 [Bradyrhizobium canariense]|uniref:COG3904 family protein n=1 Tax=Bradyrhizobium canariense TaxID=255045 RepID=UPI000A199EB3|nr:hypothetical protein [Bradyrhizobium canariense]OSI78432.1 hypothetical protein BSZ21_02260 [Bradyrhizobium canariense]